MGLFSSGYMRPNPQSKAVKAYLEMHDGVEPSWDSDRSEYARVEIAEWHNCREVGYVVMFWNANRKQLNIAFFEHRNSDEICAVMWEQDTINPPTIDTAKFGSIYSSKYDVSHSVPVGHAMQMADWIYKQFCAHWVKNDPR